MTRGELHLLGLYLYGPRWQTRLARALAVDPRMVRYWAAGARSISERRAATIGTMARDRHLRRLSAERSHYIGIVEAVVSPGLRAVMLAA